MFLDDPGLGEAEPGLSRFSRPLTSPPAAMVSSRPVGATAHRGETRSRGLGVMAWLAAEFSPALGLSEERTPRRVREAINLGVKPFRDNSWWSPLLAAALRLVTISRCCLKGLGQVTPQVAGEESWREPSASRRRKAVSSSIPKSQVYARAHTLTHIPPPPTHTPFGNINYVNEPRRKNVIEYNFLM